MPSSTTSVLQTLVAKIVGEKLRIEQQPGRGKVVGNLVRTLAGINDKNYRLVSLSNWSGNFLSSSRKVVFKE
jgi:hypothetical protein